MDEKDSSNDADIQINWTWRRRVTSSLRLPVSKNKPPSKNCLQEKRLSLDETTKLKGADNGLTSDSLLPSDFHVAVPEVENNGAIKNGTSNENYIRIADDNEDQSWADSKNDIDKHEKSCVNFETSNISQTSGIGTTRLLIISHVSLPHPKKLCFCHMFLVVCFVRLLASDAVSHKRPLLLNNVSVSDYACLSVFCLPDRLLLASVFYKKNSTLGICSEFIRYFEVLKEK